MVVPRRLAPHTVGHVHRMPLLPYEAIADPASGTASCGAMRQGGSCHRHLGRAQEVVADPVAVA